VHHFGCGARVHPFCRLGSSEEIVGGFRLRQLAKRVTRASSSTPLVRDPSDILGMVFALLFKPSTTLVNRLLRPELEIC
jgi:hypothetical protein